MRAGRSRSVISNQDAIAEWHQLIRELVERSVREAITYNGPVRLYFDPSETAPAVWCIAAVGREWKINVRAIAIDGAHMRCVYAPDDASRPHMASAWLEGRVNVTITDDGRAVIKPEGAKE